MIIFRISSLVVFGLVWFVFGIGGWAFFRDEGSRSLSFGISYCCEGEWFSWTGRGGEG